ncbi:hypothetical protein H8356DRAFT_1072964 [Neocallimastix lanati (nom. inval.)]|nr:hypothetical protein H8356DRAFT_1072964 [Neocallimastix sp. JGI-2020a]
MKLHLISYIISVLSFKRIDEIKEFISPYVKEDRTPDENGKLPGRINEASLNYDYSYEHFEGVTEFSTVLFKPISMDCLDIQEPVETTAASSEPTSIKISETNTIEPSTTTTTSFITTLTTSIPSTVTTKTKKTKKTKTTKTKKN